jgi:hypothetical protein
MTSIISRFSYVVLSRTRQSYNDFKLVQSTSGKSMCKILSIIDLIATLILKP